MYVSAQAWISRLHSCFRYSAATALCMFGVAPGLRPGRIDGHHLYFRAALCGAVLFSIALAVRIELVGHFPAYRSFDSTLFEYIRPVLKVESGLAARCRHSSRVFRFA